MIARAIGISDDIAELNDVAIDRYFWNDPSQRAAWRGPVTANATLGNLSLIARTVRLDATNVIGEMNAQKLVILRGAYNVEGGGTATHWMLGTLYTKDAGGNLNTVVANDPWSGRQVEIDPVSKTVMSPADFPLMDFKVNGYQSLTVN